MDKKNTCVILCLIILSFAACSHAARVGIVVEYPPGGADLRCVSVPEDASGYDVMQASGLNVAWAYFPLLGHALCSINYVGCPSSNCFCDSNEYWNFYVKGQDDRPGPIHRSASTAGSRAATATAQKTATCWATATARTAQSRQHTNTTTYAAR
jgi:hypothetical protein